MPLLQDTQMVWGIVIFDATTEAPTAAYGSGNFSIAAGGTGLYDVIFDETVTYTQTPTVVVTQIFNGSSLSDYNPTDAYDGGSTLDNSVVIAVEPAKFRLMTGGENGNKQNRMFSFVAVGPGSQAVAPNNDTTQVTYGNIVYDSDTGTGNEIERASGEGGVTLYQRTSDNTWGYARSYDGASASAPSQSPPQPPSPSNLGYHPPGGEYGIKPSWSVSDVAIMLQQIFGGQINTSTIDDFGYDGGSTHDNAVAESISANPQDMSVFGAGDQLGNHSPRNVGFIAVGD